MKKEFLKVLPTPANSGLDSMFPKRGEKYWVANS
jgi:hypothetical protein